MSDFRVQYISGSLASGQTQKVLTAPTDFLQVDTQRAFILPATSMATVGMGANSGSSELRNWLMHAVLDATQIFIDRGNSGGTAAQYAFYIIEYVGTPGGANEIRMRGRRTMQLNAGTTGQDSTAIAGVSTIARCIPFVCSLYSSASTSNLKNFSPDARAYNNGSGDVVRIERASSDSTAIYTTYCVEFTGSNWTIQSGSVNFTAANTDIDVTINAVSITRTWLHSYYKAQSNSGQPNSGTAFARMHSTTRIRVRALTSVTQPLLRWFAIENSDSRFSVQQLHAIDGVNDWLATTNPQVQQLTTNLTAEAGVFIAGQAGSDDGSSTSNNPCGLWRFKQLNTTTVEAVRLKSIGGTEYVVQIVQLPADAVVSVTVSPPPTGLTLTGGAVNGPIFVLPGVASLSVQQLGPQSEVFRTPATAVLQLLGYSASVIAVNPAQAALSLVGQVPELLKLAVISPALPPLDYTEGPALLPTIIFGTVISPNTGALRVDSIQHSATEGGDISIRVPGVGAVSILGLNPEFSLGESSLGAVTLQGLAPDIVGTHATCEPGLGEIVMTASSALLPVAINIPFQWIDVDPAPVASWE